jgi:hypothetical protein
MGILHAVAFLLQGPAPAVAERLDLMACYAVKRSPWGRVPWRYALRGEVARQRYPRSHWSGLRGGAHVQCDVGVVSARSLLTAQRSKPLDTAEVGARRQG